MTLEQIVLKAGDAIRHADALLITAGAGMGVDSGLPDFRGDHGFWTAYPMYQQLGINFIAAANPAHFKRDPAFGWGFYGHRTNLYRETVPHAGFSILQRWIDRFELEAFVVTSNVDGQFQKAGFAHDAILEVHGSIHHMQCLRPCHDDIWPNIETFAIDFSTMRSQQIPTCPRCHDTARPNILMFGDDSWISSRSHGQNIRFDFFQAGIADKNVTVIELGAGSAVPTIRYLTERLGNRPQTTVIRINPREPEIRPPHLAIGCGALDGLQKIDAILTA
ncbi:MAG: NAD-dependent deacetylase [Desulfuromonadales bacterium]|nr:NAD-dependent deacetylase [Desulfuromonadales bacterium]